MGSEAARRPEPAEPDAALAAQAAGGDAAALGALLARHRAELLRLCRRLVGDAALAEDCAQDACLLAVLRLHRLRRPEDFGAWLRGIGVRTCRRALERRDRDRRRAAGVELVEREGAALPDDACDGGAAVAAVADAELARVLRRAVEELPAGQRAAVRLFYLGGLSYDEAAGRLGIATGALKVRLHKARAALRHRFRLDDGDDEGGGPATRGGASALPRGQRIGARTLAVHEAGHAVLHWLAGGLVVRVTISPVSGVSVRERVPDGNARPAGTQANQAGTRLRVLGAPAPRGPAMPPRAALQVLMAGEAATFLSSSRRTAGPPSGDRVPAAALARGLAGGDDVEAALIVEHAWTAARDRLADQRTWSLVQAVAEALIEHHRLDGEDFRSLVSR